MPHEFGARPEVFTLPPVGALVTVAEVVHINAGKSFTVYGSERLAEVVSAEPFKVSEEQLLRMGCIAVRTLAGDGVPRLTSFLFAEDVFVASRYRSPLAKLPPPPKLHAVILHSPEVHSVQEVSYTNQQIWPTTQPPK